MNDHTVTMLFVEDGVQALFAVTPCAVPQEDGGVALGMEMELIATVEDSVIPSPRGFE